MKLNQLKPSAGSGKTPKKLGRGDRSGHGGTSTRGHKGHKSRSGFHRVGNAEGGQMPFVRRIPKRGFTSQRRSVLQTVNVGQLNDRFAKGETVSPESMGKAGLIKRPLQSVKILGKGKVDKPLEVRAHYFSAKAKSKLENSGGKAVFEPFHK